MNLADIIKGGKFDEIQNYFKASRPVFKVDQEAIISQFKVGEHTIFDETIRPKKPIWKDSGERDAADQPKLVQMEIDVARIAIPFQKLIVNRRVGFMLTDPVTVDVIYGDESQSEKDLVKLIERIQNNNKMDYKNKEVARRLMSECECAEIWYFVENEDKDLKAKFSLKVKVISPDLGDSLYPIFDKTGDLVLFARGYKVVEDGKEVEHFDVYTIEGTYYFANRDTWKLDETQTPNPVPNPIQKIPIIYYRQEEPEWNDVQSMIERYETLTSNHADTNDYFGSPILTVIGEISGYAQKGETGKILELTKDSQANYLALSSEPQSIKMEEERLEKLTYSMSQTPDITFEKLRNLGTLSGVALELMFLDAHMAVKNKEEIFGLGLQRRLNLIKASIGMVIDTSLKQASLMIQIKPVLKPYLPENVVELIDNIVNSINNKILSQETGVSLNPLVSDSDTELERIQEDSTNDVGGKNNIESFQNVAEVIPVKQAGENQLQNDVNNQNQGQNNQTAK